METKDKGTVTIEKGNKKQVACHKFTSEELNRELMVHENVDCKNHTSVSDCRTGYRLFGLPQAVSSVKPSEIDEALKAFINRYTKEGIAEEFQRIENIQQTQLKKD